MALLPGFCPRKRLFPNAAFCLQRGMNFKGTVHCCAWGKQHGWAVAATEKPQYPKKCTSRRWLCPTPRIQPEPDPFVWEHFLPKSGAFLVLQAHLSLFIRFFAEPGKGYTRDPSQKHPRGLTTSKEKDTTKALPHTDVLPVPATEVKTPWPQPLLFFPI